MTVPLRTEDESFDDLLRELARAPAVRIEDLAAAAARSDLVGRTVGRFRVLARLGAGGMGVVYCAEDTRLGRNVALKVLGPSAVSDARGLELLLREARAAAAINHANVAAVYEAGEAEGIAFIAMEYVDGVTLRSRIAPGPLPIEDVLRYAVQIAEGLAKAHERAVVHRDLKPDNVMIDRDDRVKILDFGLARPALEDLSQPSLGRIVVAGTPMYMSPEQARGEPVDAQSDVFSFGIVLHEMLTGRAPFLAREGDPSGWRFDRTEVSRENARALAGVVDRCLRRCASERYADGAAIARAMRAMDGSEAVSSGRSDRPRRIALAGVGIGVAVALAALGAHREQKPQANPLPTVSPPALTRLTANIAENPVLDAALSPDGETLAYVDKTGLNLERIGGAAERFPLGLPGVPQSVAWFPDGEHLAVTTALPRAEDEELWEVSRSGGVAPRRLAHGPFTGLAVSPDGARVAFAANDSVGWLPVQGERGQSELPRLVRKSEGCLISDIAWSPDGARIAYASLCFDSLAGTAIETVAANGGAPTVVVADPHLYNSFVRAGVVWTTAGEIVYPRAEWLPAEAGSNLWSVPVDVRTGTATAPPRQITSWTGVGASALTSSGSRIAFIRFEAQTDVYVGDLSNGGRALSAPRRLTLTDRNERPAAWSKDGRGVYFFSDRSGNFDIFYQELDGSPARAVAADREWETLSQVSPDGASLLYWRFPAVISGEAVRPELVRRPLGSGNGEGVAVPVLTATSSIHPAGAGRPAPWEVRVRCPELDGVPCVLSEKIDGNLVFSALDPVRGRGDELFRIDHPTAASNIWDVSPDGTRLAIPQADGPISIQPIRGGGAPTRLTLPGCDPVTPAWSADGRGLFVSVDCEADAPPFRLYYLGLDGKSSLLWQAPPLYILETEPSPDGKHLAIAVKHKDDDVWMIERPRAR